MSDFKKSELEQMYAALEDRRDSIECFIEESPLMKKLCEMINDYCDHIYSDNFTPGKLTCMKCYKS